MPEWQEEHTPVGQCIDGYRGTGPIARGGLGEVYRGIQESPDWRVAIKILSPRLDHPNGMRTLNFGSADTTCHTVLELIEGGNLRDTRQRFREAEPQLPLARTISIAERPG